MPGPRLSRGFSRGGHPNRRKTGWEEGPGTFVQTNFTASSVNVLGAGQAFDLDGHTIVRVRGELLITLHVATGALAG